MLGVSFIMPVDLAPIVRFSKTGCQLIIGIWI